MSHALRAPAWWCTPPRTLGPPCLQAPMALPDLILVQVTVCLGSDGLFLNTGGVRATAEAGTVETVLIHFYLTDQLD